MEGLSFDTSFLIDHQRERARGDAEGPAHRFLRRSADVPAFLSAVALAEFAEGFAEADDAALVALRQSFDLLAVDEEVAMIFARLAREMRRQGNLPGTNDLWIAAGAIRYGLPLVTRDAAAFRRIPDLRVVDY
jgi:predicted nucleic acid-binding protein